MDNNIIRAIIFLVAGLALLLVPRRINQYQVLVLNLFRIKYNPTINKRSNIILSVIFITISLILLTVGVT